MPFLTVYKEFFDSTIYFLLQFDFFFWLFIISFYIYHFCTFCYFIRNSSPSHCVKSVLNRNFFGLYFPAFRLNTDQENSEYQHLSRSTCGLWNLWSIIKLERDTDELWSLFLILNQSPIPSDSFSHQSVFFYKNFGLCYLGGKLSDILGNLYQLNVDRSPSTFLILTIRTFPNFLS